MDNSKANVSVDIDWWQALNAVEKIAETRDIERLSVQDVNRLTKIASTVLDRLKEANKASQKLHVIDVTAELTTFANGRLSAFQISGAIEQGEAHFMGRKLRFEDKSPARSFTICPNCYKTYSVMFDHICTPTKKPLDDNIQF